MNKRSGDKLKERKDEKTSNSECDNMKLLSLENDKIQKLLASVERSIFECEEKYVRATPYGNIVNGWDQVSEYKVLPTTPRSEINIKDRVFTHSSYTFWRVFMKFYKQHNPSYMMESHKKRKAPVQRDAAETVLSDASTTPQNMNAEGNPTTAANSDVKSSSLPRESAESSTPEAKRCRVE